MDRLQQIARQQPEMVLDRFVEVTNDLLAQFLPSQGSGSRGQEPVNPRLVRYYTTQGWLDRPLKQGREARYTYRHLLQLLVLRRLLAEGYSASSIGGLIGGQGEGVLENILQGGVHLRVEAPNPALAFLAQVRDRSASPSLESSPTAAVPPSPATWTRLPLMDGLELHLRSDFRPPATPAQRDRLLQHIADHLAHLQSQRPP
ncbi:MAG: MerR family transcriptional regulator [Cyanobacteria bacterium REEB459]|nr:MerR family transcriptional regulator [Cyanobacteria bacterium REEB459]